MPNGSAYDRFQRFAVQPAEPANHAVRPNDLEVGDTVRLANRSVMIVTGVHLNRPANPWSGVKEQGKGAEYVFGPKHRPVKIGKARPDHPALQARQQRLEDRFGVQTGVSNDQLVIVKRLVAAVEADDHATAKLLASTLKEMLA